MSTTKVGCDPDLEVRALLVESDTRLLEQFVSKRSGAAFEALMQRHGPMVMGVCRRVLNDSHAADDVFQATFLLLVQKCRSIRKPNLLANWLYAVAYRTAKQANVKAARRRTYPMSLTEVPVEDTAVEVAQRELHAVVDEEINRLPDKYRLPLILCYLEGKTNLEAADQLGWPKGSISGRLSQARELLRGRLARRGLLLSAKLLAVLLAREASGTTLPAALVERTTRAAMLAASGNVNFGDIVSPRVAEHLAEMRRSTHWLPINGAVLPLVLGLLLLVFVAGKLVTNAPGPSFSTSEVSGVPASTEGETRNALWPAWMATLNLQRVFSGGSENRVFQEEPPPCTDTLIDM